MIGYYSVILLSIVQIITAQDDGPPNKGFPSRQGIPKKCWQPPRDVNPFECCPIPKSPSISETELEACGFQKPDKEGPPKGPPRHPDCSKSMCLLNNTNQLNADGSINYEAVASETDKWANDNPDYKEAILAAKEKCLKDNKPPPGPPHVCEADRIFHCMTFNVMWHCKPKEDLTQCESFKNHIEECKQYYV